MVPHLARLASLDLVLRVFVDPSLLVEIREILLARQADDETACAVIEAFSDGRVAKWLAVDLVGCLRAKSGYAFAYALLLGSTETEVQAYAALAMVRIEPARGRSDLLETLHFAKRRATRHAALWGLGALEDPTIARSVLDAVRKRLVSRSLAGSVLALCDVPADAVIGWLRSSDEASREVAIEIVMRQSISSAGLRDREVAQAAREAIDAHRVKLAPWRRSHITERIDEALGG